MAGTMTMTKIEFTRASLIGHTFRIGAVYGPSPLGVRIYLAYNESKGCRDSIMRVSLARATEAGVAPLANINEMPCSSSWYERRDLTWAGRQRREHEARRQRGERLDMFARQQA